MNEYKLYRLKQAGFGFLGGIALTVTIVTWYLHSYNWLFGVSLATAMGFFAEEAATRAEWRYRHIKRYFGILNDDTAAATAFAVLKSELQANPEYAWSWHCNIAMAMVDESNTPQNKRFVGGQFCNAAAARFMRQCFDVDTTEPPESKVGCTESGHEYPRGGTHQCGVNDCPADRKEANAKL